MRRLLVVATFVAAPALGHELEAPKLDFVPPAPNTYVLDRIMPAPEGRVLGLDGRGQPLSRYTRGEITLLGFIYTTCVDPQGCPLAYKVFDALKLAIESTPRLHGKVRFVTLSFDPARDTPQVMRNYAGIGQRSKRSLLEVCGGKAGSCRRPRKGPLWPHYRTGRLRWR